MAKKYYWVYMLHCSNGSYYTGYTTDMERRYMEHLQGTSKSKYTRSFKPLSIAQYWRVLDKGAALRLESYIKTLSKAEKRQLLLEPKQLKEITPCKPML
jgi:putative endonuclease